MRAVGITASPEGPEVLTVIDRDVREPGATRCGSPSARRRSTPPTSACGSGGVADLAPPWTPGMDAAGTVESIGPGVERLAVGDLTSGHTLLVTGGAGVLASYVIALGRERGLRVFADAKPEDEALVRGFGAELVLPRGDGLVAAVREEAPDGVQRAMEAGGLRGRALIVF